MGQLLVPTKILIYKTIKFAVKEVISREICVKIHQKSGKFAQNGQEENAEKEKVRKSQVKKKGIYCGNPALNIFQHFSVILIQADVTQRDTIQRFLPHKICPMT